MVRWGQVWCGKVWNLWCGMVRCGASGPCISFEGSNDLNQNEAWELWNNRV